MSNISVVSLEIYGFYHSVAAEENLFPPIRSYCTRPSSSAQSIFHPGTTFNQLKRNVHVSPLLVAVCMFEKPQTAKDDKTKRRWER